MSTKEIYTLEIRRPKYVSITEMKKFISEAIKHYGGEFSLDDARNDIALNENLKVKRLKEIKDI